jgi:hypothetical protein
VHYQIYRLYTERLVKNVRRQLQEDKALARQLLGGRHLKAVGHEELCDLAVKLSLEGLQERAPGGVMPLDAVILVEEWQYRQWKRNVFFPLPGLLESLYDSKMEVDPEAFVPPRPVFTLAIPQGEAAGGMPLVPCLVTCCTREEKEAMAARFNRSRATPMPVDLLTDAKLGERSLFITFGSGDQMARCSMPLRYLPVILQNPAGEDREGEFLRVLLGDYKLPGATPTSADEARMQYRLVKSVVHLTLYMLAFPDSVREGYPEQFVEDGTGGRKARTPHTVGGRHFHAERGSPIGHWRRQHFRSYPVRRDGSRKAGLVEVRGTWVNPDSPHTVLAIEDN